MYSGQGEAFRSSSIHVIL